MRAAIALAALAMLAACATDHAAAERWSVERFRRDIDRLNAKATAQAVKACGGPVRLVVEGDQADYGYDPSHYQCAN